MTITVRLDPQVALEAAVVLLSQPIGTGIDFRVRSKRGEMVLSERAQDILVRSGLIEQAS